MRTHDIELRLNAYIRHLGLGFHPDTRGQDYVDAKGKRVFSDADADRYNAVIDEAHEKLPCVYDYAIGRWKKLGLVA